MKRIIAAAIITITAAPVLADQYVNGYYRNDGTYVQPHYRSSPDGNKFNNYSAPGNINPYNGYNGSPGSSFGQQPSTNSKPFASPYQEGTYNQRGFN